MRLFGKQICFSISWIGLGLCFCGSTNWQWGRKETKMSYNLPVASGRKKNCLGFAELGKTFQIKVFVLIFPLRAIYLHISVYGALPVGLFCLLFLRRSRSQRSTAFIGSCLSNDGVHCIDIFHHAYRPIWNEITRLAKKLFLLVGAVLVVSSKLTQLFPSST